MPKEHYKPKGSFLGEEKWLPHTALAAVGATSAAILAVLAGWWGGLSSLLIRELTPKLLIDTVGILFLVCLVLVFSLVRKITATVAMKRAMLNIPAPAPLPTAAPASESKKPAPAPRLPEHQEKLLILAANQSVFSDTLTRTDALHPEASKFHFDAISKYMDYQYSFQKLNNNGRAYLLRHNLMPPLADTKPKPTPKRTAPSARHPGRK